MVLLDRSHLEIDVNVEVFQVPGATTASIFTVNPERFGIMVLLTTNTFLKNTILRVTFSPMWPNMVA